MGKGGGYADLEFALAREIGLLDGDTPVVTTVHPVQVQDRELPMARHDVGLDWIVTPDEAIRAGDRAKPEGIDWDRLSPQQVEAMPRLQALR